MECSLVFPLEFFFGGLGQSTADEGWDDAPDALRTSRHQRDQYQDILVLLLECLSVGSLVDESQSQQLDTDDSGDKWDDRERGETHDLQSKMNTKNDHSSTDSLHQPNGARYRVYALQRYVRINVDYKAKSNKSLHYALVTFYIIA